MPQSKIHSFLLIVLMSSTIFASQVASGFTPAEAAEILWLVDDTYEWSDFKKGISVSTSQDTAAIIITGLLKENFTVSFLKATAERLDHLLKNNSNACISNRMKTPEREATLFYSFPHDIYLGLQIYRLKQKDPLAAVIFDDNDELTHLTDIFDYYPDQVIGISGGTSYGVEIDQQLKLLKNENVFIRRGSFRLKSLAEMFFKKRLDYVIYYPTDMDKLLKETNIEVQSYKLSETPSYMVGHVTCSKSLFGKKIINRINHILAKAYKTDEFYQAHAKWVPKSDLALLDQYFNDVFLDKPFAKRK